MKSDFEYLINAIVLIESTANIKEDKKLLNTLKYVISVANQLKVNDGGKKISDTFKVDSVEKDDINIKK